MIQGYHLDNGQNPHQEMKENPLDIILQKEDMNQGCQLGLPQQGEIVLQLTDMRPDRQLSSPQLGEIVLKLIDMRQGRQLGIPQQ